jgi:hypothetical protein
MPGAPIAVVAAEVAPALADNSVTPEPGTAAPAPGTAPAVPTPGPAPVAASGEPPVFTAPTSGDVGDATGGRIIEANTGEESPPAAADDPAEGADAAGCGLGADRVAASRKVTAFRAAVVLTILAAMCLSSAASWAARI